MYGYADNPLASIFASLIIISSSLAISPSLFLSSC
jgi:hypothetical protein